MHANRSLVAVAAVATVLGSFMILYFPNFKMTVASQIATGIADAVIAPAIAGITLGLVRQAGFTRQMGRNEAFNHAGNVVAALLCGVSGYVFGLGAVFVVLAGMAVVSLA